MEEGISPKKSKLLGRFILIIVAVILIVGLFGISKKVTLRTGECEASYKYYTLEPFVSNFLSCITTIPCGSNQWFVIHNAKVSIIKCLCENVEINKNALIDYYNKEIVGEVRSTAKKSNDMEFICKEGSREMFAR